MNKKRRKKIDSIIEKLEQIQLLIEEIKEEEEECYDNLPEGIQESEKGEKFESAISNLNDAYEAVYEISEYLEESKI